jgi:hypothetical protein
MGILALIIPLVLSWPTQFIVDSALGYNFYQKSTWAMPSVFIFSAFFLIGNKLNKKL